MKEKRLINMKIHSPTHAQIKAVAKAGLSDGLTPYVAELAVLLLLDYRHALSELYFCSNVMCLAFLNS